MACHRSRPPLLAFAFSKCNFQSAKHARRCRRNQILETTGKRCSSDHHVAANNSSLPRISTKRFRVLVCIVLYVVRGISMYSYVHAGILSTSSCHFSFFSSLLSSIKPVGDPGIPGHIATRIMKHIPRPSISGISSSFPPLRPGTKPAVRRFELFPGNAI